MIKENHVCNRCSKVADFDVYSEKGWIIINDNGFHILNGRDEYGNSGTKIYYGDLIVRTKDYLDFCSLICFLRWLYFSKETQNNKNKTINQSDSFYDDVLLMLKMLKK